MFFRRSLLLVLVATALLGCYANRILDQPLIERPTERIVAFPKDSTWQAVLKVMAIYPLTVIEKESGILNTEWIGRTIHRRVSVWRGLAFGGQVEDMCPIELQERFNVLVSPESDSTTTVRVIRYVKLRPYLQDVGPKGSWKPDTYGQFVETKSTTIPESVILDAIERYLKTGKVEMDDPEEIYRREQDAQAKSREHRTP